MWEINRYFAAKEVYIRDKGRHYHANPECQMIVSDRSVDRYYKTSFQLDEVGRPGLRTPDGLTYEPCICVLEAMISQQRSGTSSQQHNTSGDRITVVLADDDDVARQGLRRLLELDPDIEVIGEAANGTDAVQQARLLSPDVVLMDIRMPVSDGLEATKQLNEEGFPGKVVIVSAYEEYLTRAIEAGAGGYLAKGAQADELVSAIRRVREGPFVFGASILGAGQGQDIALRYLAGQISPFPSHPSD